MPSVTPFSARFMLLLAFASLVNIALGGSLPSCICPKDPIYIPLNHATTVYVSALGSNSLVFATTSLPIFATNFTTKAGPIISGSIVPASVNVSLKLTPLVASNGSITVSFTDALTGSASCTIYYIGYAGPSCSVTATTLSVSVGSVFVATVLGFSPNSKLTVRTSGLPAHTNGSIIANTTTLSSVVVITALPGVPAMEVINVQFFDTYGFNVSCSVSYTVIAVATTAAPTPAPTTVPPPTTEMPTEPQPSWWEYTTYTTTAPTSPPTTQAPSPTTPNTPVCNTPGSPVYIPLNKPTTIFVSATGHHSLVMTTVNLPSFAQLYSGVASILSGATLPSASANVSVVLQPLVAINGSFSLLFSDATDALNSFVSCAVSFITYTGPTCISAQAMVVANVAGAQADAYVGAIVGFSPASSLVVQTPNKPIGITVAVNNTLVPATSVVAVSRTSALNTSAIVYAQFFDSYGFNVTCFLNVTAVLNASLIVTTSSPMPTTAKPTSSATPTASVTPSAAGVTSSPTASPTAPSSSTSVPTGAATPTDTAPSTTMSPTSAVSTTTSSPVSTGSPTTAVGITVSPTTSQTDSTAPTPSPTVSIPTLNVSVSINASISVTSSPSASPTPASTQAPTSETTSQPTTETAPSEQPTLPSSPAIPTDSVTLPPTATLPNVAVPTSTASVGTTSAPAIAPLSICPLSVPLVKGQSFSAPIQITTQNPVVFNADNMPDFAQIFGPSGQIPLGASIGASANITLVLNPEVAQKGSFTLVFVDQTLNLNTSCTIQFDVYSGPTCTVSQPTTAVSLGSTLKATVSGSSTNSSLTVSTSKLPSDVQVSDQNNIVSLTASPLSAKNQTILVTFTDKYGFNATCAVSYQALAASVLHNAAPSTSFPVFAVIISFMFVLIGGL